MTRLVKPARILLIVYSLLLAWALLTPGSEAQSGMVDWLVVNLQRLGVHAANYRRTEVLMNAVIITPVSFLGMFVLPRRTWRDWTAYGFVASVAIETVQGLLLPDRQASFSDVVANTAGACLGALLARFVWHRMRPHRRT